MLLADALVTYFQASRPAASRVGARFSMIAERKFSLTLKIELTAAVTGVREALTRGTTDGKVRPRRRELSLEANLAEVLRELPSIIAKPPCAESWLHRTKS